MNIKEETVYSNVETANSKQLAILKKHFPNCFDRDGNFIQERMLEVVNANEVELSKESYSLNWLGKSYSRLLANLPPKTLIHEDVEHNTQEQHKDSKNLLIKGDNLEVLKHLVNAYSEKVKMIYIDPPYNTGSDGFVYNDDRKFTKEQLAELAGLDLEEAERILSFTDKGSSTHSAWLTFMYPRLYIARELMQNDAVIFISIGEEEVHNLRTLCNEIFGESNFIGLAARVSKKASNQGSFWSPSFDYVLTYSKNIGYCLPFFGGINYSSYKEVESEGERAGEKYQLIRLYMTSLDPMRGCSNQRYFIECPDGTFVIPPGDVFPKKTGDGEKVSPKTGKDKVWRWSQKTYLENKDLLVVKKVKSSNLVDQNGQPAKWNVYTKTYLQDVIEKSSASPNNLIEDHINQVSSHELNALDIPFDFAKPTTLIEFLMDTCRVSDNDIVLDFFAGSGSTADSVMKRNMKNSGTVNFITVQLPELTKENSEASKKGYQNIFDITKDRINKVVEKISNENPDYSGDLGYKIFETVEDFRIEEDDQELTLSNLTMFDDVLLTDEQYQTLLTTWALYDGSELTTPIYDIDLDGYTAHLCDRRLYMIAPDFSSSALKALLHKLDDTDDKNFDPNKIVYYANNFDSVKQMELNEALKSYTNKKSIEIDVVVRN